MGKSWSNPERKEPFVASITFDGRTIIGADTDGSLTMRMAAGPHGPLLYPSRHRSVAIDGRQLRHDAAGAVAATGARTERAAIRQRRGAIQKDTRMLYRGLTAAFAVLALVIAAAPASAQNATVLGRLPRRAIRPSPCSRPAPPFSANRCAIRRARRM